MTDNNHNNNQGASKNASDIVAEVRGRVGCITLNRPRALNALSLQMVRDLMAALLAWQHDEQVLAVAIRGNGRDGAFGAFCAGGDIRFLHAAGTSGNPELEDFFTEEYALNHLIHTFGKPYIAFMDGIVMGGGMGISQGGSLRIVTERTKMAMPETIIGLFPDVGGGYFLSRCPGRVGEWLALTGETIGAADAIDFKLADGFLPSDQQAAVWEQLGTQQFANGQAVQDFVASKFVAAGAGQTSAVAQIDQYFALPDATAIVQALEAADGEWERATAALLRKRSPLMLHVVLEQIRRARDMSLADDLRMERDMVRHCFYLRPGQSETVEGIRALAVDKDHSPKWQPARVEDVAPELVQAFFDSPWPAHAHPLAALS
ncbi:enoyl-CoA hydratase/isomerase family protein [Melaminivora jejuensis]|uniref:enoyl-CoA hydratase/isomerase family protein n=1 Tax=Melaminivora jejuensis TaxID=1267217 RepID=UPI001ADEFBDC|nr:enoyl-CoA hydratase/isomerase family protein [Melaminivora jejuensis]UHJ66185.1 enoyl-CoA hydratase/isomerase family protein [Melaminivora jejuensis]